LEKDCKKQTILKLNKTQFIDTWPKAVDGLERAVDYLRGTFRIPVSALLPYSTLLAPFGYFFYRHRDKPDANQKKLLEDFFWRCSLVGRYSSGVESKLSQDIRRIDTILEGGSPEYDWSVDISPKFLLENGWFNTGRSFVKSILCLYAYQGPRSFSDDAAVNISNDWLKQSNSKNYHHFFPKAYLSKLGVDDSRINNVVNITIVDDYLNKREIGAKPPSVYMRTFEKRNADLPETMETHLITDIDDFGIWRDDYETFLSKRAAAISQELAKRVIKRDIDERGQVSRTDDFAEASVAVE
jgi:hypothetical protein